jgi:hypothetical protein
MALTLPEALGFVPKTIATVQKAVDIVTKIKTLPAKNAKTVGAALGVAPGSFLDDILALTDDIVAAAKT